MISINRFSEVSHSAYGWQDTDRSVTDVLRDGYCICPATLRDGHRCLPSVLSCDWLILDYDSGTPTLDEAKAAFAKYEGVIQTTKSHQRTKNGKVCDRFRVALKIQRPVTATEYSELYRQFPEADAACKDASRFYWAPPDDAVFIELTGTEKIIVPAIIRGGSRNATITSMAGRAARVGADVSKVVQAAQRLCDEPLPEQEANAIIKSAARWAGDDTTNAGLADKMLETVRLKFCEQLGWMQWKLGRWVGTDRELVKQKVAEWVRAELRRVVSVPDVNGKLVKRLAGLLLNIDPLYKFVKIQAATSLSIFTDPANELNTKTGIVDLKTGVFRKHGDNYNLRQTAIAYDPNADTSSWEKFVSEILPDPEVMEYTRRMLGYAMSGTGKLEMFSLFLGTGANGKSSFCNVLEEVLGDYVGIIPANSLDAKNQSETQPWLAGKDGVRIMLANEPSEGLRLNDTLMKELASRDKIRVRTLYHKGYDLTPTWLLIIRGNHRPVIRATDHATWRRVREIDFPVRFAPAPNRTDCIDRAGVLKWLVQAAIDYNATGLTKCASVDTAVKAYKQESDTVAMWMSEEIIHSGTRTPFKQLYGSYKTWCKTMGHFPFSSTRVGLALAGTYDKSILGGASGYKCGFRN